jgi:hypothetical protein
VRPSRSGSSIRARVNDPFIAETKFIGFHAPAEMAAGLAELARAEERSVSQQLRLMVRDRLAKKEGSARPSQPDASEDRVLETPAREAV